MHTSKHTQGLGGFGVAALPLLLATLLGCQADGPFEGSNRGNRTDTTMKDTTNGPLAELIDSLWDFRDPSGSEQRFREAAERAADEPLRLGLLTQAARAQGLQREFDRAHATLDGVERTFGRHPSDVAYSAVLPLYAIERGRVFNSSGDSQRARPLFREAWDAANSTDQDAAAVDAAHMLAIVSSGDEAVRWNELALERAESSADQRARRWRASLHNNLGWAYHEQGEYEQALDHFQLALAAREERGATREILIARWAVARCLRSLGRVEEALGRQRELAAERETLGEPDGYVFEEIGECLLALERPDEARPCFAEAHNLLRRDPWLVANEPDRLERLAELGGISPP